MKVTMPKLFIITVLVLAIALALFYSIANFESQLEFTSNDGVEVKSNLLPISSPKPAQIQEEKSLLQAEAFNHFLRLFGPAQVLIDLGFIEPVEGFKERITKKPFGIFITPETSPVKNDKFNGYHTGVDVEFTDSQEEIPVLAVTDGTVVTSAWTKGYGGVVVIKHTVKGVSLFALYGHLDPASFLPLGTTQVKAGEQIGVLGDDHSEETDGARKHLHFSIYTGEKIDFRGYIPAEEELADWLNPLDFY